MKFAEIDKGHTTILEIEFQKEDSYEEKNIAYSYFNLCKSMVELANEIKKKR